MKRVLFLIVLLWATEALAASPTKLSWDRNVDADGVDHYNVFTCSTSSVCVPNANIGQTPQTAIGGIPAFIMPANTEVRAAVTAVDLVGNQSGQSNIVNYDSKAPPNPQNLRPE